MRALRAGAAVLACLAMVVVYGPQALAEAADPTSVTLTGWSGENPVPVALIVDAASRTTAVFTSDEDGEQSLWVADRSAAGDWGAPSRLAADITRSSADFAENSAGAAVQAWDAPDGSSNRLFVAHRAAGASAWSTPDLLATDQSEHQPSIGIDDAGRSTVGYLHDHDGEAGAYTQSNVAGTWQAPTLHSTAAARQVKLAVAVNGDVAVALAQDRVTDETDPTPAVDLYALRFRAATQAWDPRDQVDGGIAEHGIVDIAVNDDGDASIDAYSEASDTHNVWNYVSRNREAWHLCTLEDGCFHGWEGNGVGNHKQAAMSPDGPETFVASVTDWGDGSSLDSMESNGSEYDRKSRLALGPPNSFSDPQIARSIRRIVVTWLAHTEAGAQLTLQGQWRGRDGNQLDAQPTVLGITTGRPAIAVSPGYDTEVLWTDATTSALRFSTLPSMEVITPHDEFTEGYRVPVHWSVPPNRSSPNARYDVRVRQATYRHGFAAARTWKKATKSSSARFVSAQGRTSCFSTRIRERGYGAGAWSSERCTAVPMDEKSLHARGWSSRRSTHFFDGHLLQSTRRGATLSLGSVRAKSLALLVSKRPGGGKVRVTLGGHTLKTISTKGRRADKVIVPIAHFRSVRHGTLRITTTSGAPVMVDGVFISAQ